VRVNRPLTGAGAEREVRHLELDLMGAPLSFQVGDSFGLHAPNDPAVVAEVLAAARAPADAPVRVGDDTLRLDDALRERFELTSVDPRLLTLLDGAPELPSDPSAEPHVVDVLRHAGRAVAPQALVDALRRLAPRLYSLASSPLAHPGEAHFTASVVDYEAYGRHRMGVATGWMAQRLPEGALIQVHVQPAPAFRLAPPEVDVVMIGPGTGIAPFRAFLQERSVRRGRGRSWLFFGSRHEAQDALYADELAAFRADGVLSRLDLAWSRDQPEKVYVQDRMLAAGAELWAWLQGGAHIYVCGDASRMAPDVHRALQQIAAAHGGMDAEAAKAWVKGLAQAGRYQRDVY
jgi:sulfite reductase (NADPH) flavoprotein alpha-component